MNSKLRKSKLKIAMLQVNPTINDFDGNLAKLVEGHRQAIAAGCQVAVASELVLTGYPPRDLLQVTGFILRQSEYLAKLCQAVADANSQTALVVGFAESHDGPGKPLFNSAAFIGPDGAILKVHRKQLLPTYGPFDELRYFKPGNGEPSVIEFAGERIALLVCEDVWGGSENPRHRPLYDLDPIASLAGAWPSVVIVVNSSPYHVGKGDLRMEIMRNVARRLGVVVVYVNQTGGNDELIFDGRSFALSARGKCIACAKAFEEDFVAFDTNAREEVAYAHDRGDAALDQTYAALVLGLRDYATKNGFSTAVLGLSGGIDSALTAAIACSALGAENVLGITMPSPYSSPGSVSDALALAKNLGMRCIEIPITGPFEAVVAAMSGHINFPQPSEWRTKSWENVQPRLRMLFVMFYSNEFGMLPLATANKSELATGYSTIYGDTAGAVDVIGDLYKTMVFKLARWLNHNSVVIPQQTIDKVPSAELRPGQRSDQELLPFEMLDRILEQYVDEELSADEIVARGFRKQDVYMVAAMVDRNEFKRRQSPLVLKVSERSFEERRFPLARKRHASFQMPTH